MTTIMTDPAAQRDTTTPDDAAAQDDLGLGPVGATRAYLCPQRDQLYLLPPSMRDWLEPGHLVWFVINTVRASGFDTSALHQRPGGAPGRPPYEPEMMCELLLYAYCCGIRFSRQIEAACQTDAAFRAICGGLFPDHTTIARFVACHEQALAGLFTEGLGLCQQAGLVDLGVVALDGTKIAADASLAKNRDADWIGREIAKLIAVTGQDDTTTSDEATSVNSDEATSVNSDEATSVETTSVDRQEATGADGLTGVQPAGGPRVSSSVTGRLDRLRAALAQIQAAEAAETAERERNTQAAVAEAEHGRLLVGRKPVDPSTRLTRSEIDLTVAHKRLETMRAARAAKLAAAQRGEQLAAPPPCRVKSAEAALGRAQARVAQARDAVDNAPPRPARQANITDPDSRVMSTRKGWVQGYNAQAIVDRHQVVLCCDVSQDHNDLQLYLPMTELLARTLTAAKITAELELVLADAGYWSEENATAAGADRLIATLKDHKQRKAAQQLGQTDGSPPPNATPIDTMEHRLRTPEGQAAYAQRSCLIEPVFGDRKHNRQIRGFRRRGLPAARSEWAFINLAGNLLKLHHHTTTVAAA